MFSFFSLFFSLGVLDNFSDFSCFQEWIFWEQLFMQHALPRAHSWVLTFSKKKKKKNLGCSGRCLARSFYMEWDGIGCLRASS
jgi:hypothetical protein